MAKKRQTKKKTKNGFIVILLFIVIAVCLYMAWKYYGNTDQNGKVISDEVSFHFMELGNGYAGDSIYIKAGDVDILVDAGSKISSASTIMDYVDDYVTDKKFEYVIATHYDKDHISAFFGTSKDNGVLDNYKCDVIIDAPKSTKTTKTYTNYVKKRDELVKNGTKHYTALNCYNNENGASRKYELTDEIELEILYNYYYDHETTDENNNSVCFLINQGDRHFLFTGDLEKEGEEKLVEYNTLPEVELFKAGHHGSKTSSNDCLLSIIKPKIVCVCCCAGSTEYTKDNDNTFPTQAFISRISKYTKQVYVTSLSVDGTTSNYASMNGNIVVTSNPDKVVVNCSNNNVILKDTEWFKKNRKWE